MTLIVFSRRDFLRLSGLVGVASLTGCASKPSQPLSNSSGADQTAAALPLVNALRAKNGLSSLSSDPAATQAALYQAKRMADNNKMAHLIGWGDHFGARVKASSVRLPAAENIAAGQQSVSAVMQAWINSPHHLENMLGRYSGLGVAVAHNPRNMPYWAMVLSS